VYCRQKEKKKGLVVLSNHSGQQYLNTRNEVVLGMGLIQFYLSRLWVKM
jgi:hypothetical protein